ncbi:MAG: hypothetical protein NC344_07755 [Bacteroidales bacterium]|nr:hypothetical protein [Bacteroidales bacterium]MCM1147708.1 hypothetical protein [Bacteroidales bacterium]MCM1206763.1 hypothetical protein [Bacillota bacterium]MCM1510663.1 hypothetical protein [Clostridium sp.]
MNITLDNLLRFVTQAVDAGVQQYIKSTEPAQDKIKQADAKRYIAKLGYQPSMLNKWVDANLLTPVKTGEAQNSAVWYSLADIKNVISTLKLKTICNEN